MRREILKVTENNDIIWNGSTFHIYSPCNNFHFKAYSCMHDELISGTVNNNFLNMSIDDVRTKDYDERFDESLAIKTAPLTITEYSNRIFWGTPLQRPADYIEDLRNILGFSYDVVMAEIRDLMDGLGFNLRNIPAKTGTKFRMNVLENMYPCENSWDRIIRIHEFYTDEFQYQFDLVQTIKTSEKKSYKRTGFILDGYEMISIEEYSYQRDGGKYTMIYKTDHRKTHSREFLVLYTGSEAIDVLQFVKKGISYTGGPEAVFNAYNEYINATSTSENDEEDDW